MTEHEKRIREALGTVPVIGDEWVWREGERNEWGSRCFEIDSADGSVEELATTYSRHNAQFIAACNPAAIRALLADLDAMRGALTVTRDTLPHIGGNPSSVHSLVSRIDAALKGAEA